MNIRGLTFLSSFLLVLKYTQSQSANANTIAYSSSQSSAQSLTNQLPVSTFINPTVTYETVPNLPNYNTYPSLYQPPLPPIIIDNVPAKSGTNLLSLLFLMSALKNNNNGNNCNTGCSRPQYYPPDYYYEDPSYQVYPLPVEVEPIAEITFNGGYYIDEPVVSLPSPYPTITAVPGTDPYEIILTISTQPRVY